MTDMTHVIIAKSDQLNADDLIAAPITVRITKVKVTLETVQPVTIWYEGDNGKPWKPCKGQCRVLVHAWGKDPANYVGRLLTLFREPTVVYAGKKVGGIEISHMSDIKDDFDFAITVSRGSKKVVRIKMLAAAKPVKALDPELIKKGTEAASKGVDNYVLWRGKLTPEQLEIVKVSHNAEWSMVAKKADAAKKDEEIPV